jgi:malate permease and related proteins
LGGAVVSSLVNVFFNNLLPILILAGVGCALAALVGVQARPLSQLTFNVLGPALVFQTIAHSTVPVGEVARMVAFSLTTLLLPAVLALAIGRAMRLERRLLTSLVLTVLLSNAGNYGLSVVQLAFNAAALAQAAIYFATAVTLTWTVGVAVASLGTTDLATALKGVFKVPAVYAVLAGMLLKGLDRGLPLPVDRAVTLLAQAAIPVMLLLLGVQLFHNRRVGDGRHVPLAVALRLLVAPALALVLAPLFGLTGPARQAGLVQAAMPTAVVATVLADTYGLEAAFVTRVVVVSTLLSPFTLTPLLAWLGAG